MNTNNNNKTTHKHVEGEHSLSSGQVTSKLWNGNAYNDLKRNKPQWDGVNRREQADRRTYTMKTLYKCLNSPRRFNGRRAADRRFPVLDRFESGLAFLAIGLVFLSILDSLFTLTLLSHGGTEENPFMALLLTHSVGLFVGVKMLLTVIPAVLLVATGNLKVFGKIRARSFLAAALGMYVGLIIYELGLLSLIE